MVKFIVDPVTVDIRLLMADYSRQAVCLSARQVQELSAAVSIVLEKHYSITVAEYHS
jgi:hypothetical protein